MSSKSNQRKSKTSQDADSDESKSSSVSSKPSSNPKESRRRRSGDISTSTTNEPSSASADVGARHPRALSVAASEADPTVPAAEKKPRRAGFREQFLQKLRVTLDRESQNDDATIRWSTDGSSFIIIDQNRFEEETIPTYFGNPIAFASFLRKLQRWGFTRVSSRRSGRYEFGSPAFKRWGVSTTAATTTLSANVAGNDGGGASSVHIPPQQQQVMVQLNQQYIPAPPAPNSLPSQAHANAIADLISNMQRSTQPSTSTQPQGQNELTNQMNIANAISTLQNIVGNNQHPVSDHASQLNNNNVQSFQQWQAPNPTLNLLNSVLNMAGGPLSSAQMMGRYPVPSSQNTAVNALMSLSGMLQQPSLSNTNTTRPASGTSVAAVPQTNDATSVISLLLVLQRFAEEEYQRRAQVDAIQNAIMSTILRILGRGVPNNSIAQPQQAVGAPPPSRQSIGPNNTNIAQSQQVLGALHPSVGNNIQADSIAVILQAAQRGDTTVQPGEHARVQNNRTANNSTSDSSEDVNGDDNAEDGLRSQRNQKSPDHYDADDDSWNDRLRPRKKSPP